MGHIVYVPYACRILLDFLCVSTIPVEIAKLLVLYYNAYGSIVTWWCIGEAVGLAI